MSFKVKILVPDFNYNNIGKGQAFALFCSGHWFSDLELETPPAKFSLDDLKKPQSLY